MGVGSVVEPSGFLQVDILCNLWYNKYVKETFYFTKEALLC